MRKSERRNVYRSKTIFMLIAVFLSAIGIFFMNGFFSDTNIVLNSYAIRQLSFLFYGIVVALLISDIDYHLLSFSLGFPLFGILLLLSFLSRYQILPAIIHMTDYEFLQIGSLRIDLPDLILLSICMMISLIVYMRENIRTMSILLMGVIGGTFFSFNTRIIVITFLIVLAMIFLKKPLIAAFYFPVLLVMPALVSALLLFSDQTGMWNTESGNRIGMQISPADYNRNSGYGIEQSVYDIASGGIFGMGIGTGEAESAVYDEALDTYIFSGIIREIGCFGMFFILMIYFLLFWEAVKIAQRAADKFGFYLAAVINMKFMAAFVFNMFISVNLLPHARSRPPFIGYGGTELVTDFILAGIMLNISRQGMVLSRGRK